MFESKDISMLRIYASTTDKVENKPIYETIVFKAKERHLAGATVFRGVMGYGVTSIIHSSKLWELTEKLPVIVEIVDETDKIISFFEIIKPMLDKMSKGCLVTMEKVNLMYHKSGKKT